MLRVERAGAAKPAGKKPHTPELPRPVKKSNGFISVLADVMDSRKNEVTKK